jgi:hypothetical protein
MPSPKRTLPGIPGIVQKDDARNLGSCLVVVSAMTAVMIMVMGTMLTTMFPLPCWLKSAQWLFRNASQSGGARRTQGRHSLAISRHPLWLTKYVVCV